MVFLHIRNGVMYEMPIVKGVVCLVYSWVPHDVLNLHFYYVVCYLDAFS